MTIQLKKPKVNLREKLAELLNFNEIRDSLSGLGLFLGKDRTNNERNISIRGGADVDDLHIAEISAALGGTAVDVFVYDTRKDSDGGAWRERTSHTSWYNEELNTATRGGRREFPAVAVIVAESNKVITIYDGDDPDLSMWMVFDETWGFGGTPRTCCTALNGKIIVGSSGWGVPQADFIKDTIDHQWNGVIKITMGGGIINRNIDSRLGGDTSQIIVNNNVNDVAMTVLPNAPIDSDTGLPIPTIAVATDGGISVIKDDGNVVDITCSNTSFVYSYYVVFDQLNRLFFSLDGQGNKRRIWGLNNIPTTDLIVTTDINEKQNGDIFIADNNGFGTSTKDMFLFNQSNPQVEGFTSDNSIGTSQGLFKAFINKEDPSKSLYNYTTSSYNTGWMPGDIKLAALSDTKIEKVGVDETTELVTNGGFDDGTTGWVFENASSVSSGQAILGGSGGNGHIYQNAGLITGKKYVLTFDVVDSTANSLLVIQNSISGSTNGGIYSDNTPTVGSYSFIFTASSELLSFVVGGGDTGIITLDNISIKQTGELITNGTFDNGTVGWTAGNTADLSISSGNLRITNVAGAIGYAYQSITTEVGKTYTVSATLIAGTSIANLSVATNITGSDLVAVTTSNSSTFTATTTTTYVRLVNSTATTGDYSDYDNISVRLAEPDRSVNDNGLQVFGEIDKTPVATGADLVAYSGFSANDYLMQPYNPDLDFGTGDFCIMGWFKTSSQSSDQYILDRSTDGSPRFLIAIRASGGSDPNRLQLAAYDASGVAASLIATDFIVTNNVWTNFCAVFDGSKYRLFVDGVQSSIITESSGVDISNDGSPLIIGARYDSSASMSGELALLRISATAPTDAQIAKIYRDEKQLFTDGAQATLYGTSDAVTALAYDDKTELLHVGTSSGRSDFAGLRRINNTTTAVTTSISASNNLIAEQ